MKKVLFLLMFPVLCFGQYTSIPDSIFEQRLIDWGYDTIQDGQVLTLSIVNIDSLTFNVPTFWTVPMTNHQIKDFTGIEDFVNLTYLDCSGNAMEILDLTQNLSLTYLDCSGWYLQLNSNAPIITGKLFSLNISQNTSLTYLNCSQQILSNLDIIQNTALTYLDCSQNNLIQLDLSQNSILSHLNCSGPQILNLNLTQNTGLTYLNCSQNHISNLNLSQNTALTDLYCEGLLTPIGGSPMQPGILISEGKLKSLDLRNNNNINMTNFRANNNPYLYCINVDDSIWSLTNWISANSLNSNVDSHSIFSNNCNSIQSALPGYTAIPDTVFEGKLISLSYDTVLDGQVLTTNISNIDSLDISAPIGSSVARIYDLAGIEDFINLTYLDCSNNLLNSLNLTQNSALTYLSCGGIPSGFIGGYGSLESLTLPQYNTLSHLDCRINTLNNLDLSQNSALTYVNCGFNSSIIGGFNNLDVSQNPNLTYLNCEFSSIEELDVSQNFNLTYLNCVVNSLTSLDIRNGNNINFTYFNAASNSLLNCISVDDSTWSANNWTDIDSHTSFSNDCNPSSVEIFEIEKNLSVYPNPTNENITISINNFIGNIQTEIFDLIGNKLQTTNKTTISLNDYSKGIYTLKVTYGDRAEVVKVIKD